VRYPLKTVSTRTWEQAVSWLREQPGSLELVRACYYDDPLAEASERYYKSEEWKEVSRLLSHNIPCRVLDIGAGRGISSYAFAKDCCRVTALEPDKSHLVGISAIKELIKSSGLPIRAVQGHGEALPFKDRSFDLVYGRAVLHHAQDLERLSIEASRVLIPGGVFLATREHVVSRLSDLDLFLSSHPLHALYGGENAFLLDQYKRAISAAGLKLQKVIGPYDSVINYAPMSLREHRENIASLFKRFIGQRLSKALAVNILAASLMSRYLSFRCNTPGRLYSFLAVKL